MVKYYKTKKGFTLVEIVAVIAVMGLIVAGVTAGKSLVKQAQLRSVINDINKYKYAVNSFKMQYSAFPGDMASASYYWSTSNGNGNGKLIHSSNDMTENLLFWQHLVLSGLIQGRYVSADQGTPNSVPGINVPKAYWNAGYYATNAYENHGIFGTTSANAISLTIQGPYNWFYGVIRPREAHAIDAKIDDGLPARGMVYSDSSSTNCASQLRAFTGNLASVTYVMTTNIPSCRMWFWIDKPV